MGYIVLFIIIGFCVAILWFLGSAGKNGHTIEKYYWKKWF
jgi:hypothetical protein